MNRLIMIVMLLGISLNVLADSSTSREKLLEALQKEPKILSSAISGASLWVGVYDDGTRRDGYASYVCQLANRDYPGAGIYIVRVLDAVAATMHKKTVFLGKSVCN